MINWTLEEESILNMYNHGSRLSILSAIEEIVPYLDVNKSVEILTNQPRIKRPKTKVGTRDVPMPEILYDALYSIRKKFLILTEPNGMIYNSSEHF